MRPYARSECLYILVNTFVPHTLNTQSVTGESKFKRYFKTNLIVNKTLNIGPTKFDERCV